MSVYGVILSLICILDLSLTAYGMRLWSVEERSLTLSWYFINYGIFGLVAVKLFMNSASLFLLESLKYRIPEKKIKLYYASAYTFYILGLCGGSAYYSYPF